MKKNQTAQQSFKKLKELLNKKAEQKLQRAENGKTNWKNNDISKQVSKLVSN